MPASSPNLILYIWDHSSPSNAVRIVGSMLGLQFDYKIPNRLTREHETPEFRKINPMHSIPVLQDGDFIVAESHAIILYLVEKYGGEHKAKLYPVDLQTRALVHQIQFFNSFYVFPKIKNIAKPMFNGESAAPSPEDLVLMDDVYTIVEAFLQNHSYVACDHLTVADVSLGVSVGTAQRLFPVDGERFPKTKAWIGRLMENTHFRERIQAGAVALENFFKLLMQAKSNT